MTELLPNLLSHAGQQQPIHSLQSGDGALLLLVVQTLEEGEEVVS